MVSIQKPDFTSWRYSILFHSRCDAVAYNSAAFLNLFQGKKRPKNSWIPVYIWNTVYKVQSYHGICNLTHRFIGQTCNFRSEIVERQNSMVSFLRYFPAFKVPHGFLLSLPPLCKVWIYFRTRKHAKINLFRHIMVQVIEKPL